MTPFIILDIRRAYLLALNRLNHSYPPSKKNKGESICR
jgi:hypothetical protein